MRNKAFEKCVYAKGKIQRWVGKMKAAAGYKWDLEEDKSDR